MSNPPQSAKPLSPDDDANLLDCTVEHSITVGIELSVMAAPRSLSDLSLSRNYLKGIPS